MSLADIESEAVKTNILTDIFKQKTNVKYYIQFQCSSLQNDVRVTQSDMGHAASQLKLYSQPYNIHLFFVVFFFFYVIVFTKQFK